MLKKLWWCAPVVVLPVLTATFLPGCPGFPGVPGGGTGDCEVAFAEFAENEPWFIVTDSSQTTQGLTYLTMSGIGTRVEQVSLLAPPYDGSGCSSASATANSDDADGLGMFEIDGRHLRISVTLLAADSDDQTCPLIFEADIQRCGDLESFLPLQAFDVNADGEGQLSGSPVELAAMRMLRFRTPQPAACENAFMTLPDDWTLSNVSPIEQLAPLARPDAVEVVVHGAGEVINTVDISGNSISCFVDQSVISFDGTTLMLNVPEGSPNEPPAPEPIEPPLPAEGARAGAGDDPAAQQDVPPDGEAGCSLQFSGTVQDCDFYVLTFAGVGPVALEVLRVEGEGQYARGDVSGELQTMYLYRRQGGEGLCGLGMIFWLPLGAMGLTGFRRVGRLVR